MTSVDKRLLALGLVLCLGAILVTVGTRTGGEPAVAVTSVSTDAVGQEGTGQEAGQAKTVQWSDLLPDGMAAFRPSDAASDFPEFNTSSAGRAIASELGGEMGPMSTPAEKLDPANDPDAPRPDLDGQRIALAGYMTPINVVEGRTRTFLLVPYVGACIHVPAPPANQIVLVEAQDPIEVREMWDPFKAVGKLNVETIDTGLAEVGYTMELERIDPYDDSEGDEKLEGVRSAGDGD